MRITGISHHYHGSIVYVISNMHIVSALMCIIMDYNVLLQVNGVESSSLTNNQMVKLLTSSETYVTILFSREPSITLL